MNTTLCLTLVLLSAGAPVPKDVAPAGPAPYVLKYHLGDDGVIRVFGEFGSRLFDTQVNRFLARDKATNSLEIFGSELVDLKSLTVYTVDGREVGIKDAARKLAAGVPAVASTDGKKVAPDKRQSLQAETMIFVAPDLVKHETKPGVLALDWDVTYPVPLLPAIPVGK